MLGAARGGRSAEVANLEALFVFDNMYTSGDGQKVIAFLQFRLARDLASLSSLRDRAAGDETAVRQQLAAPGATPRKPARRRRRRRARSR